MTPQASAALDKLRAIALALPEANEKLSHGMPAFFITKGKMFAYIGGLCGLGGVAYMARNFKNRPKDMKISVYLIHTRLLAQGTVIGQCCQVRPFYEYNLCIAGIMSIGMIYQMYQKAIKPAS